jgi:TolB-like protein
MNKAEDWRKISETEMCSYITEATVKAKEQINEVRFNQHVV